MEKNVTINTNHSCSLSILLGIAFLILKLCNVITWPWIWVLAPFWIGLAIWVLFFVVVLIIAAINR